MLRMYQRERRERTLPAARISEKGYAWLEEQAASARVSRSDVIRESMAVASRHPDELARRLERLKSAKEF